MELLFVAGLIVGAYVVGRRHGARKHSVVEMTAKDLRRELRRRK